jgi:2,3,4,5-tetrahydropyridine-2-carboxylate N-succinyltransferase
MTLQDEILQLVAAGAAIDWNDADQPLVVPEGAVVVPAARAVVLGEGPKRGLSLAPPVIVTYRDSRTDTKTELEAWIR